MLCVYDKQLRIFSIAFSMRLGLCFHGTTIELESSSLIREYLDRMNKRTNETNETKRNENELLMHVLIVSVCVCGIALTVGKYQVLVVSQSDTIRGFNSGGSYCLVLMVTVKS